VKQAYSTQPTGAVDTATGFILSYTEYGCSGSGAGGPARHFVLAAGQHNTAPRASLIKVFGLN
jgi:hypothetical protein